MKQKLHTLIFFVLLLQISAHAQWSKVGTGLGAGVRSLCEFNNDLYVGGEFTTAGGASAGYIAKWNGTTWTSVTIGTNDIVTALGVHNGKLYVGGAFTGVNGTPCKKVACWDGSAWTIPGTGTEFDNTVYSLISFGGDLYAAGAFTGVASGNGIQKWNGTSWAGLTTAYGISGGTAYAMAVYNGELYVGGSFSQIDAMPFNGISKFNGTTWSAVGTSTGTINTLAVMNGKLYAGKNGTVEAWDGTTWTSLNTGGSFINALTTDGTTLYAGGQFTTMDALSTSNIARWNGTAWDSLASGTHGVFNNGAVKAAAMYKGQLYVGGYFLMAGSDSTNYIARWGTPSTTGIEAPLKYQSVSAYPNPFLNEVMLSAGNGEAQSYVSLEVYNLIGKRIRMIHNVTLPYSFRSDALSPGMYLCVLTTTYGEKRTIRLMKE